jgi:prevent-host-death family protein
MADTMKLADAKQQLGVVVNEVSKTRKRVLLENGGIPVAAIVTVDDLKRLNRLDAEREADFAILDRIGSAFADVDPEEIEREVAKAIAEVRAEQRLKNS